MNDIYIIGARIDGHAGVIVDTINLLKQYKIKGFIDNTPSFQGETIIDIPVIGKTDNIDNLGLEGAFFHIAIGENIARNKLFNIVKNINGKVVTLIHPSAIVSPKVKINEGAFISAGAIINNGSNIGKACIINTGVIIEHDNIIGNFVHIAPGSVTAGRVVIHDLAFIGVGSTILPDIVIGEASLVGAGSTVTKDVITNETVIGYAAKKYKKNIYF